MMFVLIDAISMTQKDPHKLNISGPRKLDGKNVTKMYKGNGWIMSI